MLLESIATGTPVIATDVGGVSEIVNENNGVLISNSEEELQAVMKKMLEKEYAFSSPEVLHREIEEKYSQRIISEMLDEVYQKVLNK
ncbi:glycosyltransferase [Bergeyella porcorum]|uniref:glycosyltransferase n=1 Tax=Bergeyella porcorum TaxID=1735111 RepID=UPI002E20DFE5